jgi:hypothetical protein
MFGKILQLVSSSVGVVLVGLILNKLAAVYLSYEYVGYIGVVKSYAIFLSNVMLFGLNYSFFFLVKEEGYENSDNLKLIVRRSTNAILIAFFVLFFIFILKYLIIEVNNEQFLWIIALQLGCIFSLCSIYAKRDAVNNNYKRFFFYNGCINITLLTILLSYIIVGDFYVLVLLPLFVSILILNTSLTREGGVSGFTRFFKKNLGYAKFFYLNLLLSTGYLSLIQYFLLKSSNATEFNAIITIVSLANIISTVLGNYIFPKLVNDPNNNSHYKLFDYSLLVLLVISFVVNYFFDFFVSIMFRDNFISYSIVVVFLLQSKIVEIASGILGYKFSSELNFKVIYFAFVLSVMPVLFYLSYVYFLKQPIRLEYICGLMLVGWLLKLFIFGLMSYPNKTRFIAIFFSTLLLFFLQYF